MPTGTISGVVATDTLDAYRATVNLAAKHAAKDISLASHIWDMGDAAGCRGKATDLLVYASEKWGSVAAEGAASLAEEVWDITPKLRGTAPIKLASPATPEKIRIGTSWASEVLYGAEPNAALFTTRLETLIDDEIVRMGFETITSLEDTVDEGWARRRNKHRVRYARVPATGCCAFCLLLASRGAVYRTADTAKSHAKCRCVVVPTLDPTMKIEGYEPGEYFDVYEEAAKRVGKLTGNPKQNLRSLTSSMRQVLKERGQL